VKKLSLTDWLVDADHRLRDKRWPDQSNSRAQQSRGFMTNRQGAESRAGIRRSSSRRMRGVLSRHATSEAVGISQLFRSCRDRRPYRDDNTNSATTATNNAPETRYAVRGVTLAGSLMKCFNDPRPLRTTASFGYGKTPVGTVWLSRPPEVACNRVGLTSAP
jgi:hypothetical protein